MEEEMIQQCKNESLYYCDRLLAATARDRDEAHRMFGGDLSKAYAAATDKVKSKIRNIQMRIRNL